MPPKPKVSKADKEKQKREEAERKAREEEEQRLREEEERLAKEEQERKEREEREKLKAEEEARFLEETNNLNKVLEGQREELDKWKEEQKQKIQWQHYLSCSTLPDPSDEKATNTYLSFCEDDTTTRDPCIKDTMTSINQWLELYHKVERWLQGDGLPNPSDQKIKHYKQVMTRIRSLVQTKLDDDTLRYLQEAEKHADTETHNLRVEDSLKKHQLSYCLWGNVIKNPRMKDFSFKEHFQFTLELPKPLLLADAALRVLQLPFDDLSPQCHSYHCKRSPPSTGISTQSGSEAADGDAPIDQEEATSSHDNEEGSGEGSVDRKESVVSKPETISEAGPGVEDNVSTSGGGSDRVTSIVALEEEASNDKGDDQQQNAQDGQSQVPSISESDREKGGEVTDEVDLRGFRPAGGPIIIELLEMPPQAKAVNNWTIRKVVSKDLTSHPYPIVVKSQPSAAEGENEAASRPIPIPGSAMWPPIGITMQLPESYLFQEKPQLARWDEEAKVWRTGGFQEILFDLGDKTVTFQTFFFSPIAIMVDRYVNMPYQSWEMLPLGSNHTKLTISGGVVEISVEIKEQTSTLIAPSSEDVPVLAHLLNKPLTARELMQALSIAGANFFPELDADNYVSITSKRPVVELSVYQSMSLASSGFAFQWSRWNSEVSRSKAVLRVAQLSSSSTPAAAMTSEHLSWTTYLAGRKSYKLTVTEDSEELTLDMQDGCETHPGLFAVLEHDASSETKDRMRQTSPMHIEAIKLWLDSTKILTFS